jgi:hypothetical protein
MQRIFILNVSCLWWEVFFTESGSIFVAKVFSEDEEVEAEVREWLRKTSKDLYAAGFEPMVKGRDKCISVGGGYVEM